MTKAIPLEWASTHLPPKGQVRAIQKKVRASLRDDLIGIGVPADLLFHHVFLTGQEEEGPFVFVYGERGSDAYHCKYDPGPMELVPLLVPDSPDPEPDNG